MAASLEARVGTKYPGADPGGRCDDGAKRMSTNEVTVMASSNPKSDRSAGNIKRLRPLQERDEETADSSADAVDDVTAEEEGTRLG